MLSLRDPGGGVFSHGDRVLRWVNLDAAEIFDAYSCTQAYRNLVEAGLVIETAKLSKNASSEELLTSAGLGNSSQMYEFYEHPRVPFPTYPYEWHPLMLADAALATLQFAESMFSEGYRLKDATPYNLLFCGSQPKFVDVLSLERREPGSPYWLAENQFVRTFILPLMAFNIAGMSLRSVFLSSREGMNPEDVVALGGFRELLSPSFWLYAVLPNLFESWGATSAKDNGDYRATNTERGDFVYQSTLKRLKNAVLRLRNKPNLASSNWSHYTETRIHYDNNALALKRKIVSDIFNEKRPRRVLDIGANTGEFAELACHVGASVVAVEADLESLGRLYRRAVAEELNILPLYMNYATPSPGTGWENRETLDFRLRSHRHFDCVLMLAVIHHLVVTESIPLNRILDEVADATTGLLIIEYIDPSDPMVELLLRGRDHLGESLRRDRFESTLKQRFVIKQAVELPSTHRTLYICINRDAD